jgi:hypothetical protein
MFLDLQVRTPTRTSVRAKERIYAQQEEPTDAIHAFVTTQICEETDRLEAQARKFVTDGVPLYRLRVRVEQGTDNAYGTFRRVEVIPEAEYWRSRFGEEYEQTKSHILGENSIVIDEILNHLGVAAIAVLDRSQLKNLKNGELYDKARDAACVLANLKHDTD